MRALVAAVSSCFLAALAPSQGTTFHLTPADDWLGTINGEGLSPGDTVVLHAGTYVTPDTVMLDIAHVGTAQDPITIRSACGETAVITRNTFGAHDDLYQNLEHNVINMRGARYVVLDGLEITGGNWGIRIGAKTTVTGYGPQPAPPDPSHPMGSILREAAHVTVQNCHIHHTHNTAVSANFPGDTYDGLIFRRNEIHNVARRGHGFNFGFWNLIGPTGSIGETWSIVKNSLLEENWIHDNFRGQTWYQDPLARYSGAGIQFKNGSYNNVVRDNVIHYTNWPAILLSGAESSFGGTASTPGWNRNLIEGNAVWQVSRVPGDIGGQGLQIAANAIARNNIVLARRPFQNHSHETFAGDVDIVHNTLVSWPDQQETVRIHNPPVTRILIANNALYRGEGLTNVIIGNGASSPLVVKSGNPSITTLAAALAAAPPPGLSFFPIAGSPLLGAANPTYQSAFDFNGRSRAADSTSGAYVYNAPGNPGWSFTPGFKGGGSATCRNGTGINPVDFSTTPPALGKIWQSAITTNPDTLTSFIALGIGGALPGPGVPVFGGDLLVLPPLQLIPPTPGAGPGTYSLLLPHSVTAAGFAISSQGIRVDFTTTAGFTIVLLNAQDLVFGL